METIPQRAYLEPGLQLALLALEACQHPPPRGVRVSAALGLQQRSRCQATNSGAQAMAQNAPLQ